MQMDLLQVEEKFLGTTETSFQKQSLNTTEIYSHYIPAQVECQAPRFGSQETLEELPFNSRTLDFDQNVAITKLQQEIAVLQQRFKGIHKILINHSEFQSDLHEKKKGYKVMPIDPASLSHDFSNKVHIIGDIESLVQNIAGGSDAEAVELLDTKFQQYYLQRHYGGLNCDFGNLSIQERLDQSSELKEQLKEESDIIISKIGNFESLIPESKITYSEEFCQTQEMECQVIVNTPKFIEVEVPVLIYKLKEMVIKYQESDLCNNIDDIITKFSKPYEEIYENGKWSEDDDHLAHETTPHTPAQSNSPTSILTPSSLDRPMTTEIELAYSDFPEDNLKLPLDSYAQIQSLISNSEPTERSRPPTERETPISDEPICITEKTISRSIIERYEESEKALIEENAELKDWIEGLRNQVCQAEKKQKQLERENSKLIHRLEEEIQQTEYFSSKLEDLNAELLQEKVMCLTHLNESKERKIELLNSELAEKSLLLDELAKQVTLLENELKSNEQLLQKKEEEIGHIGRLLEEKEQELNDLNSCGQNVIQMASETEITLKQEIQKLEKQKGELKENIKFFVARLHSEGISLQIEQATEIQGIIEQREHCFSLELQQVNKKYDIILSKYQSELTELKAQLQELKIANQNKTKAIEGHKQLELIKKNQNEKYVKQFEDLINQYNLQLEQKDEEIVALKKRSQVEVNAEFDVQLVLERSYKTIIVLEQQLIVEREHKARLTAHLLELDRIIKDQIEGLKAQKMKDQQSKLIEELSVELQKKIHENSQLKKQLNAQNVQAAEGGSNIFVNLKQQNIKLRKVNTKLKRYTLSLEQQILAVCGIDQCSSHKSEIRRLMEQRDYYLSLATSCQTSANPVLC